MENTKLILIKTTLNGTFHLINSICIKYNFVLLIFCPVSSFWFEEWIAQIKTFVHARILIWSVFVSIHTAQHTAHAYKRISCRMIQRNASTQHVSNENKSDFPCDRVCQCSNRSGCVYLWRMGSKHTATVKNDNSRYSIEIIIIIIYTACVTIDDCSISPCSRTLTPK